MIIRLSVCWIIFGTAQLWRPVGRVQYFHLSFSKLQRYWCNEGHIAVKELGLPPSFTLYCTQSLRWVALKPPMWMHLLYFVLASTVLLCCRIKASEDSWSCLCCESANIERKIRFQALKWLMEVESSECQWGKLWIGLFGLNLANEEWKTLPQGDSIHALCMKVEMELCRKTFIPGLLTPPIFNRR